MPWQSTSLKINMASIIMKVWFRSLFLSKWEIFRFQPLIFQGVSPFQNLAPGKESWCIFHLYLGLPPPKMSMRKSCLYKGSFFHSFKSYIWDGFFLICICIYICIYDFYKSDAVCLPAFPSTAAPGFGRSPKAAHLPLQRFLKSWDPGDQDMGINSDPQQK